MKFSPAVQMSGEPNTPVEYATESTSPHSAIASDNVLKSGRSPLTRSAEMWGIPSRRSQYRPLRPLTSCPGKQPRSGI